MANRYAVKPGNWSDTAVWDGGTLPGAGDVVRPNTYTVTIDQDITVAELRNNASSPAAAGGSFLVSTARTITANITGSTTTQGMVTISSAVSVTINGNITSDGSFKPFVVSAGATVTVNGNITTTSVTTAAEFTAANAALTVNGNITSGTSSTGYGVVCSGSNFSLVVNGNVSGGAGTAAAISTSASGAIVVRGDVTGTTSQAIAVTGSNTTLVVDKPNSVISSTGAVTAIVFTAFSGASTAIMLGSVIVQTGTLGAIPIQGPTRIIRGEQPIFTFKDTATPTPATYMLSRLGSSNPDPANVRLATSYGADGLVQGTLAVPNPASVAYGVPTDDTTGTAALNLEAVAAVVGNQIAAAVSS